MIAFDCPVVGEDQPPRYQGGDVAHAGEAHGDRPEPRVVTGVWTTASDGDRVGLRFLADAH
jgi:hypothetical protein